MNKLSLAVAVLCGITQAAEFKLPSVTYDEKAFKNAFVQADDFVAKDAKAQLDSSYQAFIDLNHVVASARAQFYVAHGKHVKPWVEFGAELSRLTTPNAECDANKLEQCTFEAQMNEFNGVP